MCVEGNIGSGKTTFLNHFKKYDNITILEEPVNLWQNVAGTNLLVRYFEFQLFGIILKITNITGNKINKYVLTIFRN